MGWCIDSLVWFHVRDKILKDRYAGCSYSAMFSNSPIVIRFRGKITEEEMERISKLFPRDIRVEFQEVGYEGEQVIILERMFMNEFLARLIALGAFRSEYEQKGEEWIEKKKGLKVEGS